MKLITVCRKLKNSDGMLRFTFIIRWLKQCTLLECEYIKGTEVYYHEIKDVDDCYKTIFITQTKL